ncbi:MAG: segregation/condensation protein A [Alicyclobacillaceae bacterium]|nr:segregation/condensation protein A [Alicyclobacillaceae bacterium]
MAYDIHLRTFEGPLDLLLHLIETRKLNIWDIPIAEVTEQYLQYLRQMQELSLEVASEFLVMAARLLEIKSRMLLPRPPRVEEDGEDEGEDPRLALATRLVEYQSFKRLAAVLADLERKRERVWTRPPMTFHHGLPVPAGPRESPDVLLEAFRHVLWRAFSEVRQARVDREELRVEEKIEEIERRVRRAGRLTFRELLGRRTDRGHVVVSLLALLELMKEKRVRCIQESVFGEIWIYWVAGRDGPWTRPI